MMRNKESLNRSDAHDFLAALRNGNITAETLVSTHLEILKNSQPALNAATHIYTERALQEAQQLDRSADRSLPLFGLPCSVKETFGVANEQVTAGSMRMTPELHLQDAEIVRRLRAAGAIVIARSNIPEFAMTGESTNLRFGRTNNPLDVTRVAGGSSGGEGALVGSGASVFGVGSDILGSIRIPAAFCGVVGFKPHSRAIDKTGTWPVVNGYTKNWLGLGTLTRSVRDAKLLYSVIATDPIHSPSPLPIRLVIPTGFPIKYRQTCIAEAVEAARTALISAGLKPETVPFDDVPKHFLRIPKLILADFYDHWMVLLSSPHAGKFSVFKELIAQLRHQPSIDSGLFLWILLALLLKPRRQKSIDNMASDFAKAKSHYHQLLGEDGILVLPTVGLLAPKHGAMNRASLIPGVNGLFTAHTLANYLDLSAIAIPAWKYCDPGTGLPPSVSVICAPGAENRLFAAAEIIEQAIGRA